MNGFQLAPAATLGGMAAVSQTGKSRADDRLPVGLNRDFMILPSLSISISDTVPALVATPTVVEGNVEGRENLNERDDESSCDENYVAPMPQPPQTEQRTGERSSGWRSAKKRHTPEQIMGLEAAFRDCCHPSDKQRLSLSEELGLTPEQVKFWFQNRRNQLKNKHEKESNIHLRAVNERLKDVNYELKASVCNIMCGSCGRPTVVRKPSPEELRLMRENAWLKGEVDKISSFLRNHGFLPEQPILPSVPLPSQNLDTGFYPPYTGGTDF
ncbi:unnamed protein product [Spirodela intermedia]|uniref:Homeobox domain-containing protein n=1 Tax=Spirodela intermedia TaxID=51605 RepID=A0A7I8IHG7_SPIIN|nr:unnamed protein product [Spirodela intermedia]CAA6657234.1 unnamed protein product [Spirodela intermedia]